MTAGRVSETRPAQTRPPPRLIDSVKLLFKEARACLAHAPQPKRKKRRSSGKREKPSGMRRFLRPCRKWRCIFTTRRLHTTRRSASAAGTKTISSTRNRTTQPPRRSTIFFPCICNPAKRGACPKPTTIQRKAATPTPLGRPIICVENSWNG